MACRRFSSFHTPGLGPELVAHFLGGRDGRFWLAVEGKLYRFENGQLTAFTTPAATPFGGGLFLFEARDGSVWVASLRGLYRFHDGVFTTLAVHPVQAQAPDNMTFRIYEDRGGQVCLLMPRGAAKYRDGQLASVSVINGIERAIARQYGARFTLEDREGNLWIGGIGMGLHRFRPAQVTAYTAEQGLSDSSFVPVAAARDGGLWLGGDNGSIFRYRAGEFSPLSFSIDPAFRTALRALYEDRTGALWAGGYSGLLRIRDGRAVGWNQDNSALSGYPVAAIYEDRAGALWIGAGSEGSEGGLYRFQNDTFIPYRKAEGLVFNDVRCSNISSKVTTKTGLKRACAASPITRRSPRAGIASVSSRPTAPASGTTPARQLNFTCALISIRPSGSTRSASWRRRCSASPHTGYGSGNCCGGLRSWKRKWPSAPA